MATLKAEQSILEIKLPNGRKLPPARLNAESDCILIHKAWDWLTPPTAPSEDHSALFYPSAGYDLFTPTIMGLPFCTRFYFYERGSLPPGKIKKIQRDFALISDDAKCSVAEKSNGCDYQFIHADIERRVYWVKGNNKSFLEKDINLAMYFHRGDSPGEGGSGEAWDSEYLPSLARKASSGTLRIVTQGEPGGVNNYALQHLRELSINNSSAMHRDGLYFIGVIEDNALENLSRQP